jgi:uncharacterized membrane-anchored protein YhcB (DUF1043 family)
VVMKIYRERGEKQEKDRENKINDIRIKYDRYKRRLRTQFECTRSFLTTLHSIISKTFNAKSVKFKTKFYI